MDRFGIQGDSFTPDVLAKMDDVINTGYDEVGEALTRTVGDDQFLTNTAELATDTALTAAQKKNLDSGSPCRWRRAWTASKADEPAQEVALKQVKNNQAMNGDYADALNSMVSEIDDLIGARDTATGELWTLKDVRGRRIRRMALEKGAAMGILGWQHQPP